MSKTATPAAYIRKADQALSSARQLLDSGDADGACNRAYYAMFDAAQAALLAANVGLTDNVTKTHRGLISAFGQHLVLGGHVPAELGSSLNKVERLRLLADYTGDPVSTEDCEWAVSQAEIFVGALHAAFPT
ncbi:HEPN domain-containing protein [Nostoc sp. CHAB 5836]|nr:HEPN domain-containing protein [Nostoc sp. CHAB 5836]